MPSYTFDVYVNSNGSNTWFNGDTLGQTTVIIDDIDNDGAFEYGDTINGENPSGMWTTATMVLASEGLVTGIMIRTPNTMYFFPTDGTVPGNDTFISASLTGSATSTPISTLCFAKGTLIDTPEGARKVEDLKQGDLVCTLDGGAVPVTWIGRQTVMPGFAPAERRMPVRFAAGSLGHGLPHTDLTVTADHGMLVEGVICHAGALVNGTTITRVPLSDLGERFTVYHVETEAHEIIFANGAPAETFIDNASRRAFDNFDEFAALYGDVPEMAELPYPRAMSARQVPAHIRNRFMTLVA